MSLTDQRNCCTQYDGVPEVKITTGVENQVVGTESTAERIPNKIDDQNREHLRPRKRFAYKTECENENESASPLLQHPTVDLKMQIILIGDRNVGKTCFLERYTDDHFPEESKSTVGIDFRIKTVTVGETRIRLQIWDTAGQERFNSITTAYYRNARGIILFYDVTNPDSFNNIPKWLTLVDEYSRSDIEIAIVGNKADLTNAQVNTHKARNFAENCGYIFFEASAKESINVDTVFVNLIYKILKQIPQPHERNPQIRRKTMTSQTLYEDSRDKKGYKCC
uniref:Ras-related protein Rab-12 n=1 Tax=Ciona savignyi TaxID=51511 RepID=H2ZII4_CIOSA